MGHRAVQEFPRRRLAHRVPREIFNFLNHPNLGNANRTLSGSGSGFADPTSASFGRVVAKTDDRWDIQLSLRFLF